MSFYEIISVYGGISLLTQLKIVTQLDNVICTNTAQMTMVQQRHSAEAPDRADSFRPPLASSLALVVAPSLVVAPLLVVAPPPA